MRSSHGIEPKVAHKGTEEEHLAKLAETRRNNKYNLQTKRPSLRLSASARGSYDPYFIVVQSCNFYFENLQLCTTRIFFVSVVNYLSTQNEGKANLYKAYQAAKDSSKNINPL